MIIVQEKKNEEEGNKGRAENKEGRGQAGLDKETEPEAATDTEINC